MRVLVTGASGFLGRYIVEHLVLRGSDVRVLIRRPDRALAELGVDVRLGDLTETSAVDSSVQGVEAVMHVAAKPGIWGSWDEYYRPNTLGSLHILSACQRFGVKKLVYTSSPSVTFDGADQNGIDETVPYPKVWLCHYPHSKALAEEAILRAHGAGGLATCALRPHLIWGPRDPHLIPRLLSRARRGRLIRVGDGSNLVDTIHVETAARAHLLALDALELDHPMGGQAFFLSQGRPIRCWDWINELLAAAGLPPVTRSISIATAERVGAALEGLYGWFRWRSEPPMTRFLAAQLGRSHYFDISRARQLFGFAPEPISPDAVEKAVAGH